MAPFPQTPLQSAKFNLNSAGVAGFFGGKEAISAMATVHLYRGRRWLGWFNSPGSYTIAKRFGRMANNRFWDGLFPGPNDSPAVTFGLDGKKGPQYIAALSGTTMKTGHLAYLTMQESRNMEGEWIDGRETIPVGISYLAMGDVDYETPVERLPLNDALFGLIPISISIVTCITCALVGDWLSFSMILLGTVSSGLASVFIGKGKLVIKSVNMPAAGSPPGHGILMDGDEVVVIKGKERDVNAITKGRFDLETSLVQGDRCGSTNPEGTVKGSSEPKQNSQGKGTASKQGRAKSGIVRSYHNIGFCSLLLIVQFLLQLLLIPQGKLFGQIMFLVSLIASWAYNSYLSSLEKEKIQRRLLFQTIGRPQMCKFCAGTRTTMAVFACLLLFHGIQCSSWEDDVAPHGKILHSCVPNDTRVWKRWRHKVTLQLLNIDDRPEILPYLMEDETDWALPEEDRKLLTTLLEDARSAFRKYFDILECLPNDSSVAGT